MEEYQLISSLAALLILFWVMGYVFYKVGRWTERQQWHHLYSKITDQQIENGQLKRNLENAEERIKLLQVANEQMYEEGRKDVIKSTVKEMISDHDQLSFEKISQKKSIKEGEEDVIDNSNMVNSSRNISLDSLHGS